MRAEYLLFNVFIFGAPVLLSFLRPHDVLDRWRRALVAAAVIAFPYVVWDALVAGHHWFFNHSYTLGVTLFGLPLGELLFFFSVPLACIFTWECMADTRERASLATLYPVLILGPLIVGALQLAAGRGYTGLALIAFGVAVLLDIGLRSFLLLRPRFWQFSGLVVLLTGVFNGYLTARPVVIYNAAAQLDIRIGTIPVEDFVYGLSLILANAAVFEWLGASAREGLIARLIERRLGGYRQRFYQDDLPRRAAPLQQSEPRRVLVVGGGLAGIAAAATLAERGVSVTLREKHHYLGGKVAAWSEVLADGEPAEIEHGFHAFFGNYYNLRDFLDRVGVSEHLRPTPDYEIMALEPGEGVKRYGFSRASSVPVLNLLSLARHGLYNLREVALGPAGREMEVFMRYAEGETHEAFDKVSFDDFVARAQLPSSLRLVFNTFSRAFFSDGDRMSMAELIKSFHFYYLSNNRGLLYDYLDDHAARALIEPITRHLEAHGVDIRLESPVESIERAPAEAGGAGVSVSGFRVDGERFDELIIASDVVGTRKLLEGRDFVQREDPALHKNIQSLEPGQAYAVLRIWIDRPGDHRGAPFISTDRVKLLDSITMVHISERTAAAWARETGGGLIELHCYALPDGLTDEREIRDTLIEELFLYMPELRGAQVLREHMQLRRDFPAFHTGMYASRPGYRTGVRGLYLAGDWVKLPIPAMLMEAAFTSGAMSANAILRELGLPETPLYTVPREGILTGVPSLPDFSGDKRPAA